MIGSPPLRVLSVFGTRPEAIKMAPVVRALERSPAVTSRICVTGQHREMMARLPDSLAFSANHDLALMRTGQSLPDLTSRMLTELGPVIRAEQPDWVLVQGDTSTALAASLAAFYEGCAIGHVEAGLRTGNMRQPWPEEMNRRLVAPLANFHFAPTERARQNLVRENISDDSVGVTGNTVIDALVLTLAEVRTARQQSRVEPGDDRRLILVTGHRRENLGEGLDALCAALRELAARGDVRIVFPVHLNPRVRDAVHARLGEVDGIELREPLAYADFVDLLDRCHLVITDSGGIQEEAPTLSKPVLVTRTTTERPEAIEAGTARLVGSGEATILDAATRLLDEPDAYDEMSRPHNPYGDGQASQRIVEQLLRLGTRS